MIRRKQKPPQTNWDDVPVFFDIYYAAYLLGVSRATVFNYRKQYNMPTKVIGGTIRIEKEAFREWFNNLPEIREK